MSTPTDNTPQPSAEGDNGGHSSPMHGSVYSPVESLREEVARFKATNQFTPMLVTNFYAQAASVLNYVEELEQALREMCDRSRGMEGPANHARQLLRRH